MNLNGNVFGKAELASLDLLQGVDTDGKRTTPGKKPELGPVDGRRFEHGLKVDVLSPWVKSSPPRHFIPLAETDRMAKDWEKRPVFLQWIEDAKVKLITEDRPGTKVEVALLMGMAPNSMKKYSGEKWNGERPGPEKLKALGDYLGRDYRLLMDGSDAPLETIPQADWDAASVGRRHFAIQMFYLGEGLPDSELDALTTMVKAGRSIGRARKAQEKAKVSKS